MGVGLGLVFGVALGVSLDNILLWTIVGFILGMIYDALAIPMTKSKARKIKPVAPTMSDPHLPKPWVRQVGNEDVVK